MEEHKKKSRRNQKKEERAVYMSPDEESSTESEDGLSAVKMGLVEMKKEQCKQQVVAERMRLG